MSSIRQSALVEHTLHGLYHRNQSNMGGPKRKPYVLALITSHLIGMEPGLLFLKRLRNEKWIVRLSAEEKVFSEFTKAELAEATENDDWIAAQELSKVDLTHIDIVFVPILSFSLVSDILSFNEQRPFVRLILQALLSGKKVYGLRTGADPFDQQWKMIGLDKGNPLLKRKLYDQLSQIKSMGMKLMNEHETLEVETETKSKSVVTAETIRFARQQNKTSLIVSKNTIITPLAIDTARELNIALIKH